MSARPKTTPLYQRVLVDPAKGADELLIVSGYGSPAMAMHHANSLKAEKLQAKVSLILGMCAEEGVAQSQHLGFKQLAERDLKDKFTCAYLTKSPPVHSKVYVWCQWGSPVAAFAGSANYTQRAFLGGTRELMIPHDPQKAFDYYQRLVGDTIYCEHPDAEDEIVIYDDRLFERKSWQGTLKHDTLSAEPPRRPEERGLPSVKISLLDRDGTLPERSGLNWGQRPELGREPNQAYIRIPASVYSTDFFPERGQQFTVLTDDDMTLICTRAQDNGKAIHTPQNNSLIGLYFRRRLGVNSGAPLSAKDLRDYGRTDVVFFKVDSETYFMDFSPPPE